MRGWSWIVGCVSVIAGRVGCLLVLILQASW
jgi:hypothetical protein